MFIQPGGQRGLIIPGPATLSHGVNAKRFPGEKAGMRIVQTYDLERVALSHKPGREIANRLTRPAGVGIHASYDMQKFHEVAALAKGRLQPEAAGFAKRRHKSRADPRTS